MTKNSSVPKLVIGSMLLATLAPAVGTAAPVTRVVVNPSSIFIFATNDEDKSYNCTINMVWSHNSFGERKNVNVSQTTSVAAKLKDGEIFRMTGAVVEVRIETGPSIACT